MGLGWETVRAPLLCPWGPWQALGRAIVGHNTSPAGQAGRLGQTPPRGAPSSWARALDPPVLASSLRSDAKHPLKIWVGTGKPLTCGFVRPKKKLVI